MKAKDLVKEVHVLRKLDISAQNRIRVIHVISDSNIGGAGVLLCNILRHMDRSRYAPAVILPEHSALISRVTALEVPVYPIPGLADKSMEVRAIPRLLSVIRAYRPQILQTHAALSARIAALFARVPIRLATRHCVFPSPKWKTVFPVCLINGVVQAALSDRIIAVAEAVRRDLLEMGVWKDRITVILNGSDPLRCVSEEELKCLRQQYGIPKDAFVIGICARLVDCKDHDTFLHAAKLCSQFRNAYYMIVGSGPEETRLRRLALELGIADRVIFTGFVADPAPYFRLFSVNVNCSIGTETSSLAISEGYSIGLPAIVSDYGGNPAMVEEGTSGFIVPARHPEALAERLQYLMRRPEVYVKLSHGARERYQNKYTASCMTKALEAVYEELLLKHQVRICTNTLVTKKK